MSYKKDYEEVEGDKVVSDGRMFLRSAGPAMPDDFKRYIKQKIKKPNAIIVLPVYDRISRKFFSRLG